MDVLSSRPAVPTTRRIGNTLRFTRCLEQGSAGIHNHNRSHCRVQSSLRAWKGMFRLRLGLVIEALVSDLYLYFRQSSVISSGMRRDEARDNLSRAWPPLYWIPYFELPKLHSFSRFLGFGPGLDTWELPGSSCSTFVMVPRRNLPTTSYNSICAFWRKCLETKDLPCLRLFKHLNHDALFQTIPPDKNIAYKACCSNYMRELPRHCKNVVKLIYSFQVSFCTLTW